MKSFNSNATLRGGVLQILRKMATSVLAITAVLVLVGTVIGMSGCSGKKSSKDPSVSSSRQDSSQTQAAATPALTTVEKPVVTARKKTVRRARTVAYSSGTYGVSFRFPGEYTLTTPGGDDSKSTLAEGVPTNIRNRVAFGRLDVDPPENWETCRQHNILAVPSLVLYRDGAVVETLTGRHDDRVVVDHLRQLVT